MALAMTMKIEEGFEVYTFANRGTEYTVLKKIGTLGGIDVFTNRLNHAALPVLKVYNNVEEFEKTAKFLKGITKLIA